MSWLWERGKVARAGAPGYFLFKSLIIPITLTGVDPGSASVLLRSHIRALGIWVLKARPKKETKGIEVISLCPTTVPFPCPLEIRHA